MKYLYVYEKLLTWGRKHSTLCDKFGAEVLLRAENRKMTD